jgi:hypothetical protein
VMVNSIESSVFAVTCAGATLSARGAFLPLTGRGRVACAIDASSGLPSVKGTRMPQISLAHAQEQVLGQTPVRKPYTDKTRVAAIGGGARGPHPAREPEPV